MFVDRVDRGGGVKFLVLLLCWIECLAGYLETACAASWELRGQYWFADLS